MAVQRKETDLPWVIGPSGAAERVWNRARPVIDQIPVRAHPARSGAPFSPGMLPSVPPWRERKDVDLVNLHWVNAGFLTPGAVGRSELPIVWTLHDMWAFTGGCHYTDGCHRYLSGCGRCPVLGSERSTDLSSKRWRQKRKALSGSDITVVTPSAWLAEVARDAPVLSDHPVEVIPNGVDTSVFKPLERRVARSALNLSPDRTLIAFGAVNPMSERRKGAIELLAALRILSSLLDPETVEIVVFGSRAGNNADLPLPATFLGHLSDESSLALLYSSVDLCVVPSLQENFANIVIEAMSCGTPIVAFDVDGFPEAIDHGVEGLLATPFSPESLAEAIAELVSDPSRLAQMGSAARLRAERDYSLRRMSSLYQDLFERVSP